ncbi:ABC transporter ATP-binding protein [Gloeocapsopsis dulcis]|uniref:Helicase n=1 Tax=Gloeocapsopsis dulcis AAB1 = 1H9 TaxID=1433147 RepID=A0A6N8G2P7_9CHRO|nr:ABC transporter ATP-binding protein [Gloeocapsopsis dulcis]MUL38446.1 helicase [Gloeocapsopsis dulcis AAB1 = 1H9]WNN89728.1 ABC transporter ATP-binding protein [Gloeocapsopsis dulcis]
MLKIPLKQYGLLLATYLQPQRDRVFWVAITLLSSIGLQILNPLVLRYFIDTAIAKGAEQNLLLAACLFMVVALTTQILSVVATYFSENVAWTATNALRTDLVEHCLNLDLSFHQSRTPGELIERIDGDVNALSRFFSQFTIDVLGNVLLLVGILIILFHEDWRAGFSLTIFSLIALSTLILLRAYAVPYWANLRQAYAQFSGFLGERLAAIEDLQANGAIAYVMHQFYQILQQWLPIYHKARFAGTLLWSTSIGLFTLGNAIALAACAYLWQQQAITLGTAYLLFHYSNLLRQPIETIREELEDLQKAEASIHRIRDLLQVQPQLSMGGDQSLPEGSLAVTFENVWFSYEGTGNEEWVMGNGEISSNSSPTPYSLFSPPQLQNISFHLPAGQVLGILGHTGSGKTTLARLLLRLYDPQTGCIRLSDVAINSIPLADLPQRVGMVTQDIRLFQTTLRNNLTLFHPHISDDHILQTLNLLGLSSWFHALPQGLETYLGADSGGLSAGQAQLLAFARIFLKNPGLVILDEASSRLDPATEQLVSQAMKVLFQNRTGIIIAHRLATLQQVNKILILANGRMVEYGDRQTLADNPDSQFFRLLKSSSTEALV